MNASGIGKAKALSEISISTRDVLMLGSQWNEDEVRWLWDRVRMERDVEDELAEGSTRIVLILQESNCNS